MHTSRGPLLALAIAAVMTAAAAGPAAAETGKTGTRSIVHQVPNVPLVVDGIRYAPKQIHRFDGRPLYARMSRNSKTLIAFTEINAYRKDLRRFGIALPKDLGSAPPKARASGAGGWLKLCTGPSLDGDCTTINSGEGVANFSSRSSCDWFGHCWNFVNSISSVQAYGQNALLFDSPDFNRGGGAYYNSNIFTVLANTVVSLQYKWFDNMTESGFMFW
jgi:hypothetical protein